MSLTEPKPEKSLDPVELDALVIPAVASPYAGRRITFFEHAGISSFWFGSNFLWGALLVIMLPGEIRHLAPLYRLTALALLTAVSALVPIVVPLVVGALSDRCASPFGRRRPYIATGTAITLLGLTLMGLTYANGANHPVPRLWEAANEPAVWKIDLALLGQSAFLLFLLAYMVVQFGNNIATAAYCGIIPDVVPEDQRGAASGYMAIQSQLGTLAGVVVLGVALGTAPETLKYIITGAVIAVDALITLVSVRENPLPFKPPRIDWVRYGRSLWIDPKKYPDFAWVWITRALVMLGFYSILPFLNYYLIDVIDISKPEKPAGILTAAILFFSSITGIIGGYISDRVGRKPVVYVANGIIAVMALAFIVCRSFTDVLIAGILFGLGFGAYTSVDWALGTDVLPNKKDAGKEMAVWHISMTLPQTLAATIAGGLIGMFGSRPGPAPAAGEPPMVHYPIAGYSVTFVFVAFCFALGAYLIRNVRGVK